VGSAALAEVHI